MNKIKILAIGIFIFCILGIGYVSAVYTIKLYPEDYSYRSGQTYRVTYKDATEKILKQENFIWTTHYPFKDPQITQTSSFEEIIYNNIGFKAKIIRNPSVQEIDGAGRVSYSLALIPYLEAKETIVFDGKDYANNKYMTYGQLTLVDRYGNPKTVYDLGYTDKSKPTSNVPPIVWGETISKSYYPYIIKDPRCIDGNQPDCTIQIPSSSLTNQQSYSAPSFSDAYLKDNVISETNYIYETSSIPSFRYAYSHAYQGLGGLPVSSKVTDGFSRIISSSDTNYETQADKFTSCSTEVQDFNCFHYLINELQVHYCARVAPTQSISYGPLSQGYFERGYLEDGTRINENAISGNVDTVYDDCGNVRKVSISSYYKHPFEENYGPNYHPNFDFLTQYTRTVETIFEGQKVSPTQVKVIGPPNIITKAEYYDSPNQQLISKTTNERGIETLYDYDSLGRVTKLAIYPDTLDSPTATYEYSDAGYLRIQEKKKIGDGKYMISWNFYDGMGRWMQTQTKENDNSMLITRVEYDVLGRTLREYRPERVAVPLSEQSNYYDDYSPYTTYLTYAYDSLSRVANITDSADSSITKKDYALETVLDQTSVKVTDPLNNIRTFYSDARGNLVKSVYN